MSAIADLASVSITVADYVAIDPAGKATVVGAGISFLGYDIQGGLSAPFALLVQVTTPIPSTRESQASLEIILQDSSGNDVEVPGPTGQGNAIRFAQVVDFSITPPPGSVRPSHDFPASNLTAVNFNNGLPVSVGAEYKWVVKIDGVEKASAFLLVPKPQAPPVVG